jgi:hypothetical protein
MATKGINEILSSTIYAADSKKVLYKKGRRREGEVEITVRYLLEIAK